MMNCGALLGFGSNNQLAGTMAGLAKQAKRQHLGLDPDSRQGQHQNESGKHYVYGLTDRNEGSDGIVHK